MAIVSYDGTIFHGFQSQINAVGIQDIIEKAFLLMTRQKIKIQSAGRTDKGVHALNQVFHFDTDILIDEATWLKGLNLRLPLDIKIKKVKLVKDTFHARHSAKSKVYRYVLAKKESSPFTKNYEVYIKDIDINQMVIASKKFEGTHDFKGFCQYVLNKPTIKTIYEVKFKETKKHYIFEFHGNSFLKYMVRSMMGTLIQIGLGKKSIDIIDQIFETKERILAGKTAESKGLFLVKINY
jgi:tRNA pseudouridine38-40 synthase